MLLQAQRVGAL